MITLAIETLVIIISLSVVAGMGLAILIEEMGYRSMKRKLNRIWRSES